MSDSDNESISSESMRTPNLSDVETSDPETRPQIPPEAIDVSAKKTGGVMKWIKREGTGEETPKRGNSVKVHYVGTLVDGKKFDSSRDRGEPFKFYLGKGKVIRAWDQGVATMKKGELAVLYCRPQYAYGKRGSPPNIPPNAHLIFEVELLDWSGEDISEQKNGGIFKTTLVKGTEHRTPKDLDLVSMHIVGRANGVQFDERNVTFCIGEGEQHNVIPAIETGLKKMKVHEKCLLTIKSKYAFGEQGNAELGVLPNQDVEYEVELTKYDKPKETWEMKDFERLQNAENLKLRGTNAYNKGFYKSAIKWYKKITDSLSSDTSGMTEGQKKEKRLQLMTAGHLNMSMCYLKMHEYHAAIDQCSKALEHDAKNVKALYRRGSARVAVCDFEEAIGDLTKVTELDAENKAARQLLTEAQQKLREQRKKERAFMGNLFQKMAEHSAKEERDSLLKPDIFDSVQQWDNKLAEGMLPLEEEQRAFGEYEDDYADGDGHGSDSGRKG